MISFAVGLPWGPAGVAASSAGCYWLIAGPMLLIAALRAGPVRLADVIDGCYPILLGSLAAALALWAGGDWFRQAHVLGVAAGLGTSYLAHAVVLLVLPSGNRILRNAQMLRTLIRRAEA
jgi:hypothetical protein